MKGSSRTIPTGFLTAGLVLLTWLSFASCYIVPVEPRRPTFKYKAAAQGCANIFVYKWNAAATEAIVVFADREELALSTHSKTFRLDSVSLRHLSVLIDLYDPPRRSSPYCTDVIDGSESVPSRWQATSGLVTITIDRDSTPAFEPYKATVKLENVHFRGENGGEVELESETFNDVVVGWLPG